MLVILVRAARGAADPVERAIGDDRRVEADRTGEADRSPGHAPHDVRIREPHPGHPERHAKLRFRDRLIAAHQGRDIRRLLIALYSELGSQAAVAAELGVAQSTVDNWLSRLNIGTAAFPDAWLNKVRR